jgi:hypothetical protein
MLPGFSADNSLYQSRGCYVTGGTMYAGGEIAPAAKPITWVEAIGWGLSWGTMAFGPLGGVIGGVLGGVYCFFFDCS